MVSAVDGRCQLGKAYKARSGERRTEPLGWDDVRCGGGNQVLFGMFNWAIYNDLSRGHPKWCFCKGILPKMGLNSVKDL